MNGLRLVLALTFAAVRVCGQSTLPVKAEAPATPRPTTNAPFIAVAPRGEELVLTGIADIATYKRAFLQIDSPGQPSQFYTLAEGDHRGDITLVTIDSQKAKVTLRYRGHVRELSMNTRTSGLSAPSTMELQRDASHSSHHTKRAQLDRENDERAARERVNSK
jgi:hypothetical protein